MLMRAGRGFKPDETSKTKPGELAVLCRACPHPGVNLPDDYLETPDERKYRYWQTAAVDCNFRLKNRHRPSTLQDVCLSPGWSYFVEKEGYLQHVRRHATQQEVRNLLLIL